MFLFHKKLVWAREHGYGFIDLLRVSLGCILLFKGVYFITNIAAMMESMAKQSLPYQFFGINEYIIIAHLLGGAMIVAGYKTRVAAFLQLPILLGAILFINYFQGNFLTQDTSLPFTIAILLMLFVVLFYGSGQFSIDHAWIGSRTTRKHGTLRRFIAGEWEASTRAEELAEAEEEARVLARFERRMRHDGAQSTYMFLIHCMFAAAIPFAIIISNWILALTPRGELLTAMPSPRSLAIYGFFAALSVGSVFMAFTCSQWLKPVRVSLNDPAKVYLQKRAMQMIVMDMLFVSLALFGTIGIALGMAAWQGYILIFLSFIFLMACGARIFGWLGEYRKMAQLEMLHI